MRSWVIYEQGKGLEAGLIMNKVGVEKLGHLCTMGQLCTRDV